MASPRRAKRGKEIKTRPSRAARDALFLDGRVTLTSFAARPWRVGLKLPPPAMLIAVIVPAADAMAPMAMGMINAHARAMGSYIDAHLGRRRGNRKTEQAGRDGGVDEMFHVGPPLKVT